VSARPGARGLLLHNSTFYIREPSVAMPLLLIKSKSSRVSAGRAATFDQIRHSPLSLAALLP